MGIKKSAETPLLRKNGTKLSLDSICSDQFDLESIDKSEFTEYL